MHANFLKYLFGKLNDRATLKPQILFLSHYQIKLVSFVDPEWFKLFENNIKRLIKSSY